MKKPAKKAVKKVVASRKTAARSVVKKIVKAKPAAAKKVVAKKAAAVKKAAPKKAAPAKAPATRKPAPKRAAPVVKKAAAKVTAPKKAVAPPRPAAKKAAATAKPARTGTGLLPPAFADLESFVAMWALPGSDARFRQRLNSSADERLAFYHAMAPRGAEALNYLDSKPFDAERMNAPDRNLMRLMLALAEVSLTEEVNGQTVEAVHAQSNRLMNFTKEIDSL